VGGKDVEELYHWSYQGLLRVPTRITLGTPHGGTTSNIQEKLGGQVKHNLRGVGGAWTWEL